MRLSLRPQVKVCAKRLLKKQGGPGLTSTLRGTREQRRLKWTSTDVERRTGIAEVKSTTNHVQDLNSISIKLPKELVVYFMNRFECDSTNDKTLLCK